MTRFLLLLVSALPASAAEGPYFVNVASETGLAAVSAQNPAWADLNGDGWPDAVLGSTFGGQASYVFLSSGGAGGFYDFTAESGVNSAPAPSTAPRAGSALVFGDLDNDGDLDLFSARYSEFEKPKTDPKTGAVLKDQTGRVLYEKADDGLRSAVLLNDGAGRFSHLPDAGIEAPPETTAAAALFDYDNDGVLDLYAGNWYKEYGVSFQCYPSRLYRGLGGGKFAETTAAAGLLTAPTEGGADSSRPVYGVSHCDWDGDGRQDLLVSVYGRQANRLWRNNGDGTFSDHAPASGFDGDALRHGRYPPGVKREPEREWRSHGNTFSAACADYDNDGDADVFLGEITHGWAGEASDRSSLLENQGPGKGFAFRRHPDLLYRVHQDTKNWNQGDMRVSWGDFDNDGRLDLLLASGDYPDGQYLRLFRQVKPLKFEEVTARAGFDWESSGGISVADYDRDGRLDILAGKSWMRIPGDRRRGAWPAPALFRNQIRNGNHWLAVKLEGRGAGGSNRGGVGVKVIVKAGRLTQERELSTSHGHAGLTDEQVLHFGLGKAKRADSIEVRWGTGAAVFKNVAADRFIRIAEGGVLADWPAK
ncbi:MAG: CRTAC1 family protein [Elusimicrobiales bacterium]|nr:CRTAC1 family protein [Elusimicrobiales bacterium]